MANQQYPSINDIAPSWADIITTWTVSGGTALDMIDYSAIKFSDKVEVGEQRGASGGRVMARTTGSVKYEGSMTLYRSGLRKFYRALAAVAPQRGTQRLLSIPSFEVLIQHTPPGEADIYAVKLKGCRMLGSSFDFKEGNDADQIEVPLSIIEVVHLVDGLELLPL